MSPSKNSLLLIVGFFFALSACTMPKPQSRSEEQSTATFYADKGVVSVTNTTLAKDISLPVAKNFSFQVCLKDSQQQKAVAGHDFILSGFETDKTLRSDANGCVIWTEQINFNSLVRAKNVEVHHTLTARGFQQGTRTVKFAVNPWESMGYFLSDKVVTGLVPSAQSDLAFKGQLPDQKTTVTPLHFDDVKLTITEQKNTAQGLQLKAEIRAQPAVLMQKVSGEVSMQILTFGEFKTEVSLLHVTNVNGKEERRQLTAPQLLNSPMKNGYLFVEAPLTLAQLCTTGQVQLALKISSPNSSVSMLPFEGVFSVAECDQIKGDFSAKLTNVFQVSEGTMKIEDYVNVEPKADGAPAAQENYRSAQPEVGKLAIMPVDFANANALQRKKIFNVTACVTSGLDRKGLRGQMFTVTKYNGEKSSVRSNDLGCFSWDDSVEFDFLDKECWRAGNVLIESASAGVKEIIPLRVNPWSQAFMAVRDARPAYYDGDRDLRCAPGEINIIPDNFTYNKDHYTYLIDQNLSLKIQKMVRFQIRPRLTRSALFEGSTAEEVNIPVGKYLLRWALVDNSVYNYARASGLIFQVGEKVISNAGSSLLADEIILESDNIKSIGSTTKLLVEIIPMDGKNSVVPATYAASLLLINDNDSRAFTLVSKNYLIPALKIQKEKDLAAIAATNLKLKSKELLVQKENLNLLNFNNEASTLRLRTAFEKVDDGYGLYSQSDRRDKVMSTIDAQAELEKRPDRKILQKLCRYWFYEHMFDTVTRGVHTMKDYANPASLTYDCYSRGMNDPFSSFDIQTRLFLKDVKKIEDLVPQTRDMSVQAGFNMSTSKSETFTQALTGQAGLTAKFDLFGFLSASAGGTYSMSKSWSDSTSKTASYSINSGVGLTAENLSFRIRAESYEKCTVIRLHPSFYKDKNTPLMRSMNPALTEEEKFKLASRGLLLCDGQVTVGKPILFNEHYYIVNQMPPFNSSGIDVNSNLGRPFFASMRGSLDYEKFIGFVQAKFSNPGQADGGTQGFDLNSKRLMDGFSFTVPTYPGQFLFRR